MKVTIRDKEALCAISPPALSAYARAAGWVKTDSYGDHSDIYANEGKPEIVLPRTQRLGDYANVVSRLIEIFAEVAGMDDLALYRTLITADRDVLRVRVDGTDHGAVNVKQGIDLVSGAHDMLLAAACSLQTPARPFYRAGANKEASDYLNRVRLGQTEEGSCVVTLLLPVIPPPMQQPLDPTRVTDDPIERKVTKRLAAALSATRNATEQTVGGAPNAFFEAVEDGTSANLCDALVQLITPFQALDISLVWARTRPMAHVQETIGFAEGDVPTLREAARTLRAQLPQYDFRSLGFIRSLNREDHETDGTITLALSVDGKAQSATAVLPQPDYNRAIKAHKENAPVLVRGDLERKNQRWHVSNPSLEEVVFDEPTSHDGES